MKNSRIGLKIRDAAATESGHIQWRYVIYYKYNINYSINMHAKYDGSAQLPAPR